MFDFKDNIGAYTSITYRHMSALLVKKLKPFGLGAGQYSYLFALYAQDGRSQQNLADRLAVDKAAAMRVIGKLEKKGYVKRVPDENDRRAYRVHLTGKARAAKPELEKAVMEVLDVLQQKLSEEERETAGRLMKTMMTNVLNSRQAPPAK